MKDLHKDICEEYISGTPTTKIGLKYGRPSGAISKILKDNGVIIRNPSVRMIKIKCNYDYFHEIDSEEKAYFLGLLYADGSLVKNRINLALKDNDRYIIDRFKASLKSDHKASLTKDGCYKFGVTNAKMAQDLINKGCIPDKTFTLKFPSSEVIPSHLINHFIRGFFDGDGTIYHHMYNNYKNRTYIVVNFSFVGTEDMMHNIKSVLSRNVNEKYSKIKLIEDKRIQNGRLYYFKVSTGSKSKEMFSIYKYLYENATVFMPRKKEKFEEIFNLIKEQQKYHAQIRFHFGDLSLDQAKEIMIKNSDKPLWYVCKLLGRKDEQEMGNVYKKLGIPRKNCIRHGSRLEYKP